MPRALGDEVRNQSFSMPVSLLEAVDRAASARGESRSFIVREAIRQYFGLRDAENSGRVDGPVSGKPS